jgi:hypothetical protein
MSLEKFEQVIRCSICQDIATLPVHPQCCEKAKAMSPYLLFMYKSLL